MNKRFVLRSGISFFRKNTTTDRASGIWTEKQKDATIYSAEETAIWNRLFNGLGPQMIEYNPCADGHDFSEVELDAWSAAGVHESELSVDLIITCRDCGQTACVSTTADVGPRDWS